PRGVGHREIARGPTLTPAQDLAARKADPTPRLLLREVRTLLEQQGETATQDGLLRGGLASERGTGFRQEIVGERRAEGRQGAWHGEHPFRKGKKRASICCLLYDILWNPDIICGTDHLAGNSLLCQTPSRLGPRHCGQSSPRPAPANTTTRIGAVHRLV